MESQRSFLFIGLLLVSFLLWQQWQIDYGPKPVTTQEATTTDSVPSANVSSDVAAANSDVPASSNDQSVVNSPGVQREFIKVETDTLSLVIDTLGGDIVSAKLLQYPVDIESDDPTVILSSEAELLYTAQSGLVGGAGPDSNPKGRPIYIASQTEYFLENDQLIVPLNYVSEDGIRYTKSFIFAKNSHSIEVKYNVTNSTSSAISFQQFAQLKQKIGRKGGSMFMPTYRGSAYSTDEERYEKFDFPDYEDEDLRVTTMGGWVAMIEHYFVSAWVPPQEESNTITTRFLNGEQAVIGYTGKSITLAAGTSGTVSSFLYVGPKDQEVLASLAPNLNYTVDYGFLWWISEPLFKLLSYIQSFVSNWGAAIIIITIFVKGLMYPLTKAHLPWFLLNLPRTTLGISSQ